MRKEFNSSEKFQALVFQFNPLEIEMKRGGEEKAQSLQWAVNRMCLTCSSSKEIWAVFNVGYVLFFRGGSQHWRRVSGQNMGRLRVLYLQVLEFPKLPVRTQRKFFCIADTA